MINSNTYMRYLRLGLSLRPIRGKSKDSHDYAYAMHVDGVQYVLNDMGLYEETTDSEDIFEIIHNLNFIIQSDRHEIVLGIQNHLESTTQKKVWCEIVPDAQLTVLFGTEDGELAILAMDFRSEEKYEEYRDEIYEQLRSMGVAEQDLPEVDPMHRFLLNVTDKSNAYLLDGFTHPNIDIDDFDNLDDYDPNNRK